MAARVGESGTEPVVRLDGAGEGEELLLDLFEVGHVPHVLEHCRGVARRKIPGADPAEDWLFDLELIRPEIEEQQGLLRQVAKCGNKLSARSIKIARSTMRRAGGTIRDARRSPATARRAAVGTVSSVMT